MSAGIYCTLTLTHARSICGNSERVREKNAARRLFNQIFDDTTSPTEIMQTRRTPRVRRYNIVLYNTADSSAIRVAEYRAYM